MAINDVIILDQILSQRKDEVAPNLTDSEYFEIFTAEQILKKDYELSYDEIISGITGSGGDGGIDSIFVFVNGELLQEDTDLSGLKKDVVIELIIIQSKTSKSFSEQAILKFIDVTENLFDLSKQVAVFEKTYNEILLRIIQRFRDAYSKLAARLPKLKITFFYATRGSEINHTLYKKADKLKDKVKQLFSKAECDIKFFGSTELLDLLRQSPQTTYQLNLTENPISSIGKESFVCLVNLGDYYKFITDGEGNLRKHIFESNVRDYQGKTSVNEQIQSSLRKPHSEDFWWLNNGVTILATKAPLSGKTLDIENPEIVNGLQTSEEIYNYFKETNVANEKRNLLVRVIVPVESESRDRIIKATNSQTAITEASLRATEKIHRDIEEFLRPFSLYYDRRKNYYKNEGKPINKIISIPYLSQAVMAIVLQRPDDARARPSSLIKNEEDYIQLFSTNHPIKIYYVCLLIMQQVEKYLKVPELGLNLDRKTRGDIKFHVAANITIRSTGKRKPTLDEIANLEVREINESNYFTSINDVFSIYKRLTVANPVASDRVAKSPEFREKVIESALSFL